MLLALGIANLLAVLRAAPGVPVPLVGLRGHWLSERLAGASHPAVIAAVGAAFALSFDTISHALVFSMTGASLAGWFFAAVLGIVFTAGMAFTDGVNGLFVARLVAGADARAARASRCMSIAIAVLCLGLAAFSLAKYPASLAPLLSAGSVAVVLLAYLAAQTSTIDLGSAVLQIPARTPTMTAMTAATLDTLSGGRFRLGLGVSGPQVSEGWHGVRVLGTPCHPVKIVARAPSIWDGSSDGRAPV